MLKKIAIVGGVVAVAGLGLGGAAWAESNASAPQAVGGSQAVAAVPAAFTTSTSTAAPGTATPAGKARAVKSGKGKRAGRAGLVKRLEGVSHAQWVTKDRKTGAFVTHDTVKGTVSRVSAGSITIKATNGTSETYAVTSTTKVHVRGVKKEAGKPAGTISEVKIGDRATVLGTGAGSKTATRVMDRGVPKPKTTTSAAPTSAGPTTS